MHALDQRILWEYTRCQVSDNVSFSDGVGPFKLLEGSKVIPRYFSCANYDACLGYAAQELWPSFSCEGCRNVRGLNSVIEELS